MLGKCKISLDAFSKVPITGPSWTSHLGYHPCLRPTHNPLHSPHEKDLSAIPTIQGMPLHSLGLSPVWRVNFSGSLIFTNERHNQSSISSLLPNLHVASLHLKGTFNQMIVNQGYLQNSHSNGREMYHCRNCFTTVPCQPLSFHPLL